MLDLNDMNFKFFVKNLEMGDTLLFVNCEMYNAWAKVHNPTQICAGTRNHKHKFTRKKSLELVLIVLSSHYATN